jgi:Zn-dependent protease with chaperone function
MISLIVSVLVYFALIVGTLGIGTFYALIGALFVLVAQGLGVGHARERRARERASIPRTLPHGRRTLVERLGLAEVPAIYVVQAGGTPNAFATHFVSRNFAVVYSDVVEFAYEHGEAELAFVLAHVLAHVKLGHCCKNVLAAPSGIRPVPQSGILASVRIFV